MVVDSTSDMTEIQHFYVPSVASTLAEIRKRDPSIHLEVLFRSDPSLVRDLPLFRCHA
jgi:hypothetical protein